MAVSIYLFLEELIEHGESSKIPTFVEFYEKFYKALREEALAGLNRKNKYIYEFEKYTIQQLICAQAFRIERVCSMNFSIFILKRNQY